MSSARTRNPRGAGHRLRDDLVAAAEQLLQEGGEAALTMRAVTRTVGAAPQSIYAHFTGREDLLWAVLNRWFAEFEDVLRKAEEGAPSPVQRLERLCRAYCTYGLAHPTRYRLLLVRDQPVRHSADVDGFPGAKVFGLMHEAVASVVAEVAENKYSPSSRAAFQATCDLLATLHGTVLFRIGLPSFPWPDVEGSFSRAIDALAVPTSRAASAELSMHSPFADPESPAPPRL